jgi:hypothetical protein
MELDHGDQVVEGSAQVLLMKLRPKSQFTVCVAMMLSF